MGESYPSLSAPGPPCPFSSLLYQLPTHSSEWSLKSEIKCAQPLTGEARMKKGRPTVQAITMALTQQELHSRDVSQVSVESLFHGCSDCVWDRATTGQGAVLLLVGLPLYFLQTTFPWSPWSSPAHTSIQISAVSCCRCRTICPLCSLIAVHLDIYINIIDSCAIWTYTSYHCDCHIWVNT